MVALRQRKRMHTLTLSDDIIDQHIMLRWQPNQWKQACEVLVDWVYLKRIPLSISAEMINIVASYALIDGVVTKQALEDFYDSKENGL